MLADTDRARLRPLTPTAPTPARCAAPARTSSPTGSALPTSCANTSSGSARRVGLFADIDSQISLTFLDRFDCQDRADWLSPKRLAAWLASVGYCGRTDPAVLHARLTSAPRGAIGEDGAAETHVTRALLTVLRTVSEQIKALSVQIDEQLTLHADAHIFTSPPRAGRVRAARLFAEIGACRARFPTPESLACLAGVAPSTRQSGKIRTVGFRWACDKQLRDAVTDFAGDSRHANPWAADLYDRARGHDHPHAIRILARAWLYVLWHCWQDNTAYDPDRHGALQRHPKPQPHSGLTQGYSLGQVLGVASCDEDDLYAAMDWALQRKEAIENTLAA